MSSLISRTIASEGSLLLISFLFGILLMLIYDIFRILRRIIKHGTILTAIEDVIYWLFCAIGIFAMLYQENDGLLRWFVVGGVAVGMLLENKLISPWVIRLFVKILKAWMKIIKKIFDVVVRPVKKVCRFLKKELKKLKKAIKIGLSKQ